MNEASRSGSGFGGRVLAQARPLAGGEIEHAAGRMRRVLHDLLGLSVAHVPVDAWLLGLHEDAEGAPFKWDRKVSGNGLQISSKRTIIRRRPWTCGPQRACRRPRTTGSQPAARTLPRTANACPESVRFFRPLGSLGALVTDWTWSAD